QAEDGIRDFHVTGVQTCALPISLEYSDAVDDGAVPQTIVLLPTAFQSGVNVIAVEVHQYNQASSDLSFDMELTGFGYYVPILVRSEERRVGKEDRCWRCEYCE